MILFPVQKKKQKQKRCNTKQTILERARGIVEMNGEEKKAQKQTKP